MYQGSHTDRRRYRQGHGTFVLGVFNSELTDDQLKAKASTLSFVSIRASIAAGAGLGDSLE
jgi:hypothetical protein